MAGVLTFNNPFNVTDAGALELDFPTGATTAVVGGTTYLFVTGTNDDGVSVFSVAANGTLTNAFNVTDAGALELDGAYRLTTAVVGGTTYLFVTGDLDDGVSVFSVAANGALTNVVAGGNVTDDATLKLDGATGVATALAGGNRYLFVAGFNDDGVSVFSVSASGALTNVANVTDAGALELDGAEGVATAIVGGTTYLFATGLNDDGVSVFRVNTDGTLTSTFNVTDSGALELDGANGVTTAVVGGTTYLFVAGTVDNGVSVFSVAANGTLTNVFNVNDDATLKLAGAYDLTTATYGGTTYLYVTGSVDDGVSVFSVAANGALTNVANIADAGSLELNGAAGIATATLSNTAYVFATGQNDNGVSVLNQSAPTGQLWYVTVGGTADGITGHVNSDGSNVVQAGTQSGTDQAWAIGIDLAAGFYFTISEGVGAERVLESHSIANPSVVISTIQIASPGPDNSFGDATDDIINALVVDPYNDIVYVGLWGQDTAHTGIVKATYNPATGVIASNANYGTGGVYDGDTQYLITNSGTGGKVNDIRYMALDTNGTATTTDDVIYYSDDNNGSSFFNGPTNQIYSVNVNTGAVTQLSSNANAVGGFPTDYSRGNIEAVAFNKADGLIYFMTHDLNNNAGHLWWMPIAGGLATEITAPAGHTFSIGDVPTAGLTFDPVKEQLYITVQSNDPQGFTVDEVIQAQMAADGKSITGAVNSYSLSVLDGHTPDANSHAVGGTYDQLPTFTKTDVGTAAGEQGSRVDLISSPSITDTDGNHLASATVQISGSFAGSGDLLFVLDGGVEKTSGTFTGIPGITIAETTDGSGNITLTLTGYDTLADYQTLLNAVGFRSTGDNPTNYGYNDTRTIDWTVSDGAQSVPFGGQNTGVTTLSITAVNDGPTNNLPASLTVNEDVQTALTGITFSDPDADPANQDITVTFSVAHGTLNVLTNVLNGILASDITGGAQDSNSITITAPINSIDTMIAGNGLRYTGDLNFNSGFGAETLHIVTSDNGHTGTGGALGDTDDLGITVNAVNDNPNLQPDTTTAVSYTENAAPTALFAGENIDTPLGDVDQSANYATGSIDFNITAGAVSGDRISLTGATFHISGGNIQDSGNVNIGAISGNGTSHVTISALTSAATPSVVDALIQSFGFDSTSDNPGAGDRTITLTFNDGGNTGSGGALTDAVTQTEHVTPVNDAPVATTPVAHYTATEQVNLNLHGTGLSVSDVDGNSGNETVTLSVGEGTITLSAGNSGVGSISGSGTSSLTFSGTLTQLNALLSGSSTGTLVYNDPSDTPVASTTLTLLIHDNGNSPSGDLSASANATIDITAVNDAPNAVLGTDPYAATEQVALDIKNTSMSVSDVDALGAVEVATLSVTQGVLNITAGTSGVTVGTNGTSSVTLTGTLAQINALLNTDGTSTVSYTETNDNPSATVTLTLQINDQGNTGTGGAQTGTDTSTINITAVNDAPVATITPTSYSATEQVNLSLKNNGLAVSDVDGNSGNETVTLSVTEGTLTLGTGTSGVIIDSGNGTSSVTFHGTLAQLNDLLNTNATSTVVYNDNTDTPAASATLTLTIHDNGNTGGGDLSANDTATINITAVNDAPTASMTTDPYTATEQTALDLKNTGMSVSDVDALGAVETATLSVVEGTLHVDAGTSGALVTGDNSSSVTITGTLAQINALLNTDGTSVVNYIDNTDNPSASTTLTLQIDDQGNTGTGGALVGQDTSTINITAVNDAPVATITPTEYDSSPNVAINLKNNGLSVSDVDGNAGSETVTLSTTPDGTLTVTAGTSGAVVSNSGTSSVTITGTLTQINALLNTDGTSTVSFVDAVGGTKTLTLLIHDNGNTGGGDLSAQDTASIVLDNPPVVDLNGAGAGTGSILGYTENAAASAIAPAGITTDTDSADFNGGSLAVHFSANGAAEDQLSILTDSTILLNGSTVQYDADGAGGNPAVDIGTVSGGGNGTDLVVSFTTTDATPASISALIEHIGYADNSDNPSTAARTLTFSVDDGDGATGSADATINITAVNDGPAATITPTSYSATEQTSLNLKNSGLAVSDVDGNAGSETVTLSVAEGTLTVTAGGSGAIVNNSGTASVTISGTIAQINALLNTDGTSTVSYIDNTDDPSASTTLTLLIHDNGNTGTGGDASASDTATINIAAVNDPPALTNVPATADYTENAGPVTFSAAFPNEIFVTDPDPVPHGAPGGNGLALSATVKIASGFVAGDELLVFDTTTATSATSGFYTGINIQWDYDATTHILTLFSADPPTNSGDTLVDFAHVLDNVQFASTSDDPANGGANPTRTLQWQIQDAGGTANGGTDLSAIYTTTLTVHPTNDAPVAAITPTSYSATEQTALDLKNNGLAVSDVDGDAGSETVTLSVGEGVLNVTAGGSGAGVAGSGTNSVTITGSAAQIDALLNTDGTSTVGYIDNTDTPGASTTLTLLIHDNGNTGTGGDLSSSDSATINITAVDDVPVLNGLTDTPTFIENGSPVRLDANQNATVSDPELNVSPNKYQGASLTIMRDGGPNADDAFVASGSLDVTDVSGTGENVSLDGGVTFIGTFVDNGDGSIKFTFNSSATAANIHDVMAQIFYSNVSDNPPATVPVDFIFDDGNGQPGGQPQGTGSGVTTATVNVQVTQIDDAPALLNVAVAATYSIGSAGAILSPGLQAFDPDAAPPSPIKLASATITIASGFLAGDQLFVNLPTDGSGHFITPDTGTTDIVVQSNAGGQLVLSGSGDPTDGQSVLAYQEVLDAVAYRSTAVDPTNGGADQTRTITWKLSDGVLDNQAPSPPLYPETTLGFNSPPSVDLDGSTAGNNYVTTFTENGAPLPIANANVSVTDADDSSISSAAIVLNNAKAGDALSIAGALPSGISSSIDTSVAGQITLNLFDSGTLADYQTALSQIRFVNSSEVPDTTDRDITVQVANSGTSNIAHATVHVVSVNDAPVNTVPGAQSVNEDTNLAIAGLAVSDVDAVSGTLTTTLSVAHGTLTVASAGGAVVSGSTTNSVTLTGTLAQINTTLSASGNVVYKGVANFNGGDTLNVVTNDGGNTGTGGAKSDTDTVGITVNAVNDAPVLANFGAAHASTTEQTFVRPNPGATVSDVDLDAFNAGAGNYAGASLIIGRTVAANPEDTFFFGGAGMTFTIDTVNHALLAAGLQFATYNIPSSGSLAGTISVNFNSLNTIATSALVNNVLDHIVYADQSDTPPASVTLHYTFNDGNAGAQGSGGNLQATANRIVDITAVNDPPVIVSDGGGDTATISVLERTTAVTTVVAPDPDGPSVTYSIVGGADAAKFQIDSSTGALSFVSAPNFDIATDADHNNSYLVQVRASDGSLSDDQAITVQVTNDPNVTSTVHWVRSVDIAPHPAGWVPQGNGDFNGDGTADLAWYNASTNNIDIWTLSNGTWAGTSNVGSHPAGYQPVGFGDYNGDHTSDVLWFNPTTHDVDLWKISNGQWAGSVDIGTHPAGYQPVLSGDFNGDGTSDIAWYNPTTNAIDVWKISTSGQWAGSVDVGPHPAGYQPVLAGDFNGDGTSDIAWFNPTTGDLDIWKMSNGQWAGSVDVGSHPAGWQPLGAADFNLDGTSDIAWYNPTTNDIDIWLIKNGQWAGSFDIGSHPGNGPAVIIPAHQQGGGTGAVPPVVAVGVGDFDHSGVADIMWQDKGTGHIDNWMLAYS
jgi:6-phosphogluconolactonase (cycloisomerase 2 family)